MKLELEQDVKGLLPEKDYDRRDFMWTALGASAALALPLSLPVAKKARPVSESRARLLAGGRTAGP